MTWILAFVFILGAAVILHEFGHFLVAKLLGIRVETFSVGFGKRLWGRRWGATDYRLSLVPLGGYVKLGGDDSNAGLEEGGAEEIPAQERFDLRRRGRACDERPDGAGHPIRRSDDSRGARADARRQSGGAGRRGRSRGPQA